MRQIGARLLRVQSNRTPKRRVRCEPFATTGLEPRLQDVAIGQLGIERERALGLPHRPIEGVQVPEAVLRLHLEGVTPECVGAGEVAVERETALYGLQHAFDPL